MSRPASDGSAVPAREGGLHAWIEGVGIVAPGLADWAATRAILAGEQPWASAPTVLPPPEFLPPAERRRASRIVKVALAAGLEACRQARRDPATLASVFASSGGDGYNCHALCEMLAGGEDQVSPTRFHNSVHNAASGYWSIATRATPAAQVLCAGDASFGAGILEAMILVEAMEAPVLLVAADSDYPEPLRATRPVVDTAALALVLAPTPRAGALAELRLARAAPFGEGRPDPLEALAPRAGGLAGTVTGMPPLRGLPLLAAMLGPPEQARGVAIEYLPPQVLALEVLPLRAAQPAGAAEAP